MPANASEIPAAGDSGVVAQAQKEPNVGKEPSAAAKHAADVAVEHQRARQAAADKADATGAGRANAASKRAKKKKTGGPARIILFGVSGALVVALGIGALYITRLLNNPISAFQEEAPKPVPAATIAPKATIAPAVPDVTPAPTPTPNPEDMLLPAADLEFMKNRVNILVLGIDESAERADWGSFRTDTMILVTINFDNNDVLMLSLPRDSYVKIANSDGHPTEEFGKINSAFSAGGGAAKNGFGYAMGTVSYVLGGIPVNYYVGFNMNVVKDIVNAMGGLNYDVDVNVNMNGRTLQPGFQHLDGQAVLDYCRQRKGSSDIERVARQQRMLKAIFNEMKTTGQLAHIPGIYAAVKTNMDTNLNDGQITALALFALRMDVDRLKGRTLDGKFLDMKDTSYWGLFTDKIEKMIDEVYGVSVHIDEEMSVTNIETQIATNRLLIAAELEAANSAIATADYILKNFRANLEADVTTQLETAKSYCAYARDEEDKELLDYYTPPLQKLNTLLLTQLQRAGLYPA
ncbi:MAG: LCP family protein [Clostridiales bacterium]|nr:LCP family protein [Clostridiales bacterium]